MMVHKTKLQSPIALKWTIPEARLQELKDSVSGALYSKTFNVSNMRGVQYFLVIYPNGDDTTGHRGQTWIFLYLNFSAKIKIEADFNIKVVSANFKTNIEHIFERSSGFGGYCFSTNELFDPENRYIVDGKLTIQMEGILMVEKEQPAKIWMSNSSGDSLSLALWKQENKDFVITVGKKEITAHKIVLATRSPVFARMFESAIKLCYHHKLVPNTTLEDKMQLLQFFDKYDIQSLKNDLEAYMITVIDDSNVCQLANCSLLTNALKLEKKCSEFLQGCLKNPKPISDFDLIDKDFAFNLLKDYFYHVSS
uniref:BTB domain-containing protein n=1 Tax=Panagrolaimus sp. ES5 TaxID=591445 RepID=A0AC34FUW1_9BILA